MKLRKLALALGLVFSSGLLITGCSDGSSSAAAPSEIEAITKAVNYQFVFIDAATGAVITDALDVTFTGEATLLNPDGTAVTKSVAKSTTVGFATVIAKFGSTGSNEFSVLVGNRTKGWIETGTTVVGKADLTGDQVFQIKLTNTSATKVEALNESNTAIGMKVDTSASASAEGKISKDVVLATVPKTVTVTVADADGNETVVTKNVGTAALSIPKDTVAKAADGSVATGALTVASTYYANADDNSMSAFPGGFATSVSLGTATVAEVGGATSASSGSFVTGGFAQFNVTDANGKAIKNFNPPVEVGIDLPKDTLAADGVTLLKVGDPYPVWSFDDATGQWKFEKMGTVAEKTPVDPDNYTVKFATSHLSSWNLDFYIATCTGKLTLNREAGDTRSLKVTLEGTQGRAMSKTLNNVKDSVQTFYLAPIGTKVMVKVYDGATLLKSKGDVNLCSGSASIVVPAPPVSVSYGTVKINTYESCANGTKQRAVPTTVTLFSAATSTYEVGYTVKDGTVATKSFDKQKLGSFTAYALNPRTATYESKPVTLSTKDAVVPVNFGWTMTCPSGGAN